MRKFGRPSQGQFPSWARLAACALAGLILAALLFRTGGAALAGLFQSEVTPPPPTAESTSTATLSPPTAAPTLTATLSPETPAPTLSVTVSPTPEVPAASPTAASLAPTATPLLATPQPLETPTLLPAATAVATVTPARATAARTEPAQQSSSTSFSWGRFLDTLGLVLAYTWLACGLLVLIAAIVLFVFLWRASRHRREAPGQDQSLE